MKNVLEKILNKKKEKISNYKKLYPINDLLKNIKKSKKYIDFKKEINKRNQEKKITIISEISEIS